MNWPSLVWGSPEWRLAALVLLGVGGLTLLWNYWRAPATTRLKLAAGALKAAALAGLALCLVEPLWSGTRPRRGANLFALVADNSRSMTIRDTRAAKSRGQRLQDELMAESDWQTRLRDEFDTRCFAFDSQLRAVNDFAGLKLDGNQSCLHTALAALSRRLRSLPAAGVLLFTDGNATDSGEVQLTGLPPVYPIVCGGDKPPPDISVTSVSATQTNFDSAPVVVRANVAATGHAGEPVIAQLIDEQGRAVQSESLTVPDDAEPLSVRFQLRPKNRGVNFYRVRVAAGGETDNNENPAARSSEATLDNNERLVVVDRGGGPYRVLYVCGRPNWEFKFLRRALADDDQLELVGLVRIARREPKFSFRSRNIDSTNPLYSGFDNPDEEATEGYDQPVLLRLGTADDQELRGGFPKTAADLYRYDAVILDDVEADFFTHDQLSLLENFVSRRGGGLLMLGGVDSFSGGGYARTPIEALLPIYLEATERRRAEREFRLALTREGWLQPWVRLRKTEPEERRRLASMTPFRALSFAGRMKPAAAVLAEVLDANGEAHPALATQRFGHGRTAALLLGDMWRWGMHRKRAAESDLEKAWRQTVRWLVADVPQRVEVTAEREKNSAHEITLRVRVHDAEYLPLDNASVTVQLTTPDGKTLSLDAEPDDAEAGAYVARYASQTPGAYRAAVSAIAPDGSEVGQRDAGWVAQPATEEFVRLAPNRSWLEQLAAQTGGEVVEMSDLPQFVASLSSRKVPISEPWIRPLWHHPLFYLAILMCLTAEWGLRRWRGLA